MTRHVGLVCPYPADRPGGVQAHVRDLAVALHAAGHRVSVLAPVTGSGAAVRRADGGAGDEDEPLAPVAARVWGLPPQVHLTVVPGAVQVPYAGSASFVTSGRSARHAVLDWLEEAGPDLLHLHEPMAPSLSLIAPAVVGDRIPSVTTFHSAFTAGHSLRQILPVVQRTLRDVDAHIAVSASAHRSVRECFGVSSRVIPTGVRVGAFSDPAPRAPWCEGPGRPTVAFIGRSNEHRKGLRLFLEALVPVARRTPGARVFVAGPGQAEARRLVDRDFRGLRSCVVWLGELTEQDKASLMRSVSAVVAPQVTGENFGITLVEAMAAGAPVVASDLPAFVSVLAGAGVHFRAGDAGDLSRVLQDVLLDPPLRREMSDRGRRRAARFDWHVVGREVMEVYEEVMAS